MLIQSIAEEIALRSHGQPEEASTLYFGGGTPSILEEAELRLLFKSLRKHHSLEALEECTLEANPEDITDAKLRNWHETGIDRLSIGTQSFFKEDLRFMNRHHSPEQAVDAVKRAQDMGFENITIDLIYGIPQQSWGQWQENIGRALELNTKHLSSYCLTIEPRTALHRALEKGTFHEKEEEEVEREFLYLHTTLETHGLEHYEISNFALPGWQAKHNSAYWNGLPYAGYGPAAHSFDGQYTRSWNVANNARYMNAMDMGKPDQEKETLSDRERWNEVVMTSLRTARGIDMKAMHMHAPEGWLQSFMANITALAPHMSAWLLKSEYSIRMLPEEWLQCDALVRELIVE